MGIKSLTKLLGDAAAGCIREQQFANYTGRKIAIDASMSLYQFLIAVRSSNTGESYGMLTNEAGEVTSHIQGLLSRTIRLLENGIKPVFVFDGKPPAFKSGELAKRAARRQEAQAALTQAEEEGKLEDIEKYASRLIRVTPEQNAEAKRLLKLMGVPIVEAPCEAEAQCAALCKAGKVYATASEDMDSLTLGTPILLRYLTFSDNKRPILEFSLPKALEQLGLTMEQFVDLCILCGCDYSESIRGIGPSTALKLIKAHGSIEAALKHIDTEKHPIPSPFPFADARELFLRPDVSDPESIELVWTDPDEAGLRQFLITEKSFNADRVENSIKKLKAARGKSSQSRLESFFGNATLVKRKADPVPNSANKKAKKEDKKKPGPRGKAK
eukprot:GILJ01002366.1.p1 GENE.GILJ01002366.1~~GILJ01002366.1.p1  ORF type:complete len:404 (-),score=74.71 GILJ01002366.1:140-1294(-)